MSATCRAAAGVLAACVLAAAAHASEPRVVAGPGPALALVVVGPAGPSETFAVDPVLPAALRETALEETVRVADWPVAPGDRRTVELTRHDVYAPNARIVAVGAGGETEVPRSRLVFFWGAAAGDPSRRVLLSLDPETGTLGGLGVTPDGVYEVRASGRPGEYRIASSSEAQLAAAGKDAATGGFTCGGSPTHPDDVVPAAAVHAAATTSTLSSLHTATVAVDTDNELLSLKFADSTAGATSYLASLFAGMNVIYERDLFVRLLQGHTILRLSSAADPWTQPGCPAWPTNCQNPGGVTFAQLTELSDYWATNYAAVPRALAMMVSGKQSSNNSFSGTAWINGLCSGSVGYSYSQVFKFPSSTAANDVSFVAHELGHNFGSGHTHCYPTVTTPIDTCYNAQSGCYSGPTSCPAPFTITPINGGGSPVANVRGTVMSYCHLLAGCSASAVFHPQTVDVIGPIVDGKVGVCVFPNAGATAPTISTVVPSSGPPGGGTTVTLTGTGFQSGATVTFLDASRAVAAASVSFVSGTTLTAVTPAHAAGLTDVVVGSPTKRTATKSGGFAFTLVARVVGTKTVSGTFSPGVSIAYNIALSNTGGAAQPNVAGSDELTDVLPSSLALVSATATAGTATATPATNTVVWNGSIASGASVTVTIQATVKAATALGTVVSNQGTVRFDGDGDGTSETTVPTDDPGPPGANDPTEFTVRAPPPASSFYTLGPCRLVDTRGANGPAIAAGAVRTFTLANACGLPPGAQSVSLNVTVVAGSALGNVVVYPGDLAAPFASTLNFAAGQTRANFAIVGLATNGAGTVAVKNRASADVHVILDTGGYFQ